MQTLKFVIHGSYYDSQIYSGQLYLWSNKGSIIIINWDRLIESFNIESRLRLALRCAFQQSEYLYGADFKLIFQDEEIKKVIQQKFSDLREKTIELSEAELRRKKLIIAEQDNPLPFPHADSLIYNNDLYVGSPSGVSVTTFVGGKKKSINPGGMKLWDGPVLGVAASYSTLALAAGSEGLFQCPSYSGFPYHSSKPSVVSNEHSNSVRWMYTSIFSSSYFNGGYLADFTLEETKENAINETNEDARKDEELSDNQALLEELDLPEGPIIEKADAVFLPGLTERKLREIVPSQTIFSNVSNGASSYAWGVHDKICLAKQSHIEVAQYSPYKPLSTRFKYLGRVETAASQGDIVRGDSALFGYILEFDEGLLVIDSEVESSTWIAGEPVNWRVFPKSKFYTNQLHVIYDDYLSIHSFNQDYFVDQRKKRVGIRHSLLS